jgi:hypothetical protein
MCWFVRGCHQCLLLRCNTLLSKVHLLSSLHVGRVRVFMYSTPLNLLSSLYKCYDWNNEGYMLTIYVVTLFNKLVAS